MTCAQRPLPGCWLTVPGGRLRRPPRAPPARWRSPCCPRRATSSRSCSGRTGCSRDCRPARAAMGDPERILHVGGNGAGYTVKLMINLLWFAHLTATAEVLTVGTMAGVDLATLRRCLLASPAASNFLERDVLQVLRRGDYDESFTLALACKDLGLAVDLARQAGVPLDVGAAVNQVYRRARARYGDNGGEMMPIKLLEDLTATQLRLAPPPA